MTAEDSGARLRHEVTGTLGEIIEALQHLRSIEGFDDSTPVWIGVSMGPDSVTVLGVIRVDGDRPPGMGGMRHRQQEIRIVTSVINMPIRPAKGTTSA